jgi:hypothetical protein
MFSPVIKPPKNLPSDIVSRGPRNTIYKIVYDHILDLPISSVRTDEDWTEIGNLPNKTVATRLQACVNPSVSKQGKNGKHPRAYQSGLMAQNAKVLSHKQEHKDGTYSLWVKKVSRSERV